MKMTRKTIFLLVASIFLLAQPKLSAQPTFPQGGIKDEPAGHYAFTRATIFVNYQTKLENATLLIRNGKVVAAGVGIAIPKDAVTVDCDGKFIYPSFVELYSNYGIPEAKAEGQRSERPQFFSNKKGAFGWNEAIKPEFDAAAAFATDAKRAAELRELGFGVVLTHRIDGIHRGTATLVTLDQKRKEHETLLMPKAAAVLSFKKGTSTQDYPSSLMGCIALLRQTYLDADWYDKTGKLEERNLTLEAWNNHRSLPQIFDARDRLEVIRAQKIAKEFGTAYIFKGNGDEYQRTDAMKATATAFILPLNFPAPFEVDDPLDAMQIPLNDLKHWELAPTNLAKMQQAGVSFAITANGTKPQDFLANLRRAVQHGLSEADALKALTFTPARLVKADAQIGSLEKGKWANFFIASRPLFDEKTAILQNWVQGNLYEIKPMTTADLRGTYQLVLGNATYELSAEGNDPENAKLFIQISDTAKVSVKHVLKGKMLSLAFNLTGKDGQMTRLAGTIDANGKWMGNGQTPQGDWFSWTATRSKPFVAAADTSKNKPQPVVLPADLGEVIYPFVGFGNVSLPTAKTHLLKNATVWTNEAEGKLENTDVLLKDGKIAAIGKNLSAPADALVVNAEGKHITAGIIDEHSHIAISRGVNEGTQYSSAEVSIADVVNSEDINIYRQLAGGVTMAQLLHGSANPIGGQAAIVKLRWGRLPEEMKVQGADPSIKFALGENVKQSNWGDLQNIRYPQTRMGVEQTFEELFTRAREYEAAKKANPNARTDLEMETILQILQSKRFVTCHSYVQSEINMLMKLAERYGFRINTFTHILEGYKVAKQMATHGAGGSTFADWWAYKYEVIDAIPQNAGILHRAGVVTAINSDDAEMGRRLNQEAGKIVMYSGISEEDALKMVTLNPAKLLHLDNRTGSIKIGKDADVVIWSAHPLSVFAKAEVTFVDGVKYFDRTEDAKMQSRIAQERTRIIQKMILAKKDGAKTQPIRLKQQKLYHCDSLENEVQY